MGSGDREVVCCALGGGWEGGGPASRAPPLPPGRYHHLSSIIGDNRKRPVSNYGRLRQGLPLPHFHQTTQAQPNQSLRTSQGTKELKGVSKVLKVMYNHNGRDETSQDVKCSLMIVRRG